MKLLQHSQDQSIPNSILGLTTGIIAAYRLTNRAIQVHRSSVLELLQACRAICNMQIASRADFGNGLLTEPYFYEGGYICGELETSCALPVTVDGKCVTGELVFLKNKDGSPKSLHWKCHAAFRPLSKDEVDAIISLKQDFEKPINELRKCLHTCDDGCLNSHYDKQTGHDTPWCVTLTVTQVKANLGF